MTLPLFSVNVLLLTYTQLHGVDEPPTLVTLVTASFWVAAVGTDALYEAVGEEALAVLTAQLLHGVFQKETMLVDFPENILGNPERIREDRYSVKGDGRKNKF